MLVAREYLTPAMGSSVNRFFASAAIVSSTTGITRSMNSGTCAPHHGTQGGYTLPQREWLCHLARQARHLLPAADFPSGVVGALSLPKRFPNLLSRSRPGPQPGPSPSLAQARSWQTGRRG